MTTQNTTTENNNQATTMGFVAAVKAAQTGGFLSADEVGFLVSSDAALALQGLVEVMARQTADERATGGTAHKNKFGFSKKHVTRGTALAKAFMNGEEFTAADLNDACTIAQAYRNQLWMIVLGAVPVNNLNLRG